MQHPTSDCQEENAKEKTPFWKIFFLKAKKSTKKAHKFLKVTKKIGPKKYQDNLPMWQFFVTKEHPEIAYFWKCQSWAFVNKFSAIKKIYK